MDHDRIIDIEWRLWRDLCVRLEETGLVTPTDLRSPATEQKTAGQQLIHAIKAWAENRSNDIAVRHVLTLCHNNEYIMTAIREWGQAFAMLPKTEEVDLMAMLKEAR